MTRPFDKPSPRRWIPALVCCAVLAATLVMWRALVVRDRMNVHAAVQQRADAMARELERRLVDRAQLLDRLGARRSHDTDSVAWEMTAGQIARDYPGLRGLAWADSGSVVRVSWPGAGEVPKQRGHRLDGDARQAEALHAAIRRGTTQLVAPVVTDSLDVRSLLVVPVMRDARLEGYLSSELAFTPLLDDVIGEDVAAGYAFSLHSAGTLVYARSRVHPAERERWQAVARFRALGRDWTLEVVPTVEMLAHTSSAMPTWFLLGGLACTLLVGQSIRVARLSREQSVRLTRLVSDLAAENEARRQAELVRDEQAEALTAQAEELEQQNDHLQDTARMLEEKRAELAGAQEFRAALVRSTLDGVAAFDAAGCVSEWNPAMTALTGCTEAEVDGQMIGERLTFLPSGDGVQLLLDALAGRTTQLPDVRTTLRTGEEVWLDVRVVPMQSPDGRTLGGLLVARDVTERKRAADLVMAGKLAAEEANRAKSGFLARMSHELRTPLNSVIGFTNVLRRNRHGRLERDEITYLERINANGRHLLGLINDVLDLSKIEAGRETVLLGPTSLASLIRDTVEEMDLRASGASVRLVVQLPPGELEAVTDESKLKQVLINLIGNAIKFTPPAGEVTVRVVTNAVSGRPSCIEVEDTGIGIPDDRLSAIFEAFEQADEDTSRRFGGTGLGLAISQKLCLLMGHDLIVQSEVGVGSTFMILLPDEQQGQAAA